MQSQGWPPRSCGDCWPRGRRMNWRTYNSLRRTEGHWQCPISPAVWPWGQCPYPRKDSRWRTGLYFYNIKDQEVASTVLITGVAALVTDTCTVEPAHCCTRGCWAPVREAELSPDVRMLKSHCSPSSQGSQWPPGQRTACLWFVYSTQVGSQACAPGSTSPPEVFENTFFSS